MKDDRQGFLLIASLFVIAMVAALSTVGLSRTMTELVTANRSLVLQQTFHVAEAGLDDAIRQLQLDNTQATIDSLLVQGPGDLGCALNGFEGHTCTIDVKDNVENIFFDEASPNLSVDSDRVVLVAVTATAPNGNRSALVATVQLPGSVFDQGIITGGLFMDYQTENGLPNATRVGRAELNGIPANKVPLFLRHSIKTDTDAGGSDTNTIQATQVQFLEPNPTCPKCPMSPVFPDNVPSDVIRGARWLPTPMLSVDLTPYYSQAIAQQSNPPNPACNYHHITTDTVIDGLVCPTLEGIIYVERGVNLDLKGELEIKGTIVHEGYHDQSTNPVWRRGVLQFMENANVTINSAGGTAPIAPGMAIVGGALVDSWESTTMNINGAVMIGGSDVGGNPTSFLGGHGTIDGGVYVTCTFSAGLEPGQAGPVRTNAIDPATGLRTVPRSGMGPVNWFFEEDEPQWFGIHEVTLHGDLQVLYRKPPDLPPGFSGAFSRPRIISWHECVPNDSDLACP